MIRTRKTNSHHVLGKIDSDLVERFRKDQKREAVVNDNVYLMGKKFHRKDIHLSSYGVDTLNAYSIANVPAMITSPIKRRSVYPTGLGISIKGNNQAEMMNSY